MSSKKYLCVHGHYYQPPRGNPFSKAPLIEKTAAPYRNWNERVNAECYSTSAKLGIFERVSFNLGETLASWLAEHDPTTYDTILSGDRFNVSQYGTGNAIGQSMHHTILPLDRRVDKATQVKWGKAAFAARYGRQTEGMWMPEMAVDLETLEVLAENGIEWTVLTDKQVVAKPEGSGPFWVKLPNGKQIKVFVRDEGLSNDIAFNLGNFGGAGTWAKRVLGPRRDKAGDLTLIATDGETFGHHWRGEDLFLHYLLSYEARSVGYEVVTLARYAKMVQPTDVIMIREDTAWSSGYGLDRWLTGSPDTPGDSFWKGALRRAFDGLKGEIDDLYEKEIRSIDPSVDPIQLRDGYIDVVLGGISAADYVTSSEIDLDHRGEEQSVAQLIEAQYYRQAMYASCAFFFAELTDLATAYGIANAGYAITLMKKATGIDLEPDFQRDLRLARGVDEGGRPITGEQIYQSMKGEMG